MQYFTIIALFLTAVTAAPLSVDAKVEIGAPVVKTGDSPIKLGDKDGLPIKVGDKDSLLRFGSANNNICTGTYKAPQCCTASVQGVANVDCIRPDDNVLTSLLTFEASCRSDSRRAMCCGVSVAGQALLCVEASVNSANN